MSSSKRGCKSIQELVTAGMVEETNDKPVSKERFWPKLSKLEDKREQISALEDKLQNDKLKL